MIISNISKDSIELDGIEVSKPKKVTIIDADDWQGLYVDDILELEGHRLPLNHVLKILGIMVDYHEANSDWLDNRGGFPKDFKDVVTV